MHANGHWKTRQTSTQRCSFKDSKECFNANVFSVLAVHIESKMIIFYEWTAVRFQTFFSGKFCTRLCFRLENGCAALKVQSPLTSGARWYIKGFPYPVGKFTNTSLPLRNSATAFSCWGLKFWTPNCRAYTKNGFNSCGVSSRFSSATFSERAKFGNKITQIIRVGRINLHDNQSEPLPGFRVVTSPDSIIAQCLQTSLFRDLARGGGGWNSG